LTFDRDARAEAIEVLRSIHRSAQILEIELRFARRQPEAERLWTLNVRLAQDIDVLDGRAVEQWLGHAGAMLEKLRHARRGLQAALDRILDETTTPQQMVEAIGFVEEALQIAAQLGAGC
jgi:hypothetical protein